MTETETRPATGSADAPDIKPRSRIVTDGIEATASRGMLRAVGMGDDDFAKPQIGVASAGTRSPRATSRSTGWPSR